MKVLVIGANYGLLVAGMFLQRNVEVDVFGTHEQTLTLNTEGFGFSHRDQVWSFYPGNGFVAIDSLTTDKYDLAVIATQEPALAAEPIREVIQFLSNSATPLLSIMNIPLSQFLISRVGIEASINLERIYSGLGSTNLIHPDLIINSNPEPQIFSPSKFNQLSIRLGGVFRCSSLEKVSSDLRRLMTENVQAGLPVSFKEYGSPWVSLSKLPMLIAGNYRCIYGNKLRSISNAVHSDVNTSREIYEAVVEVQKYHGAGRANIVPFAAYLKASSALDAPSSVCRAIYNGRTKVERVDRLVHELSIPCVGPNSVIADIVADIDSSIERFGTDNLAE